MSYSHHRDLNTNQEKVCPFGISQFEHRNWNAETKDRKHSEDCFASIMRAQKKCTILLISNCSKTLYNIYIYIQNRTSFISLYYPQRLKLFDTYYLLFLILKLSQSSQVTMYSKLTMVTHFGNLGNRKVKARELSWV